MKQGRPADWFDKSRDNSEQTGEQVAPMRMRQSMTKRPGRSLPVTGMSPAVPSLVVSETMLSAVRPCAKYAPNARFRQLFSSKIEEYLVDLVDLIPF